MFREKITSLADFAKAMLPPYGGAKTVAVLKAYFDESGIDGPRWCAVGTVLGRTDVVSGLERDWQAVLRHHGIDEFHSKEFFSPMQAHSQYAGWSVHKAVDFINNLTRIICDKYPLQIFGTGIDSQAFAACTVHEREYLTGGYWSKGKWRFRGASSRPYYAAFQTALAGCAKLSEGQTVNVFHDEQSVFAEHVRRIHNKIRQTMSDTHEFGPLVFGSHEEFPALQVADLVAYCTFQAAMQRGTDSSELVFETPRMYWALKRILPRLRVMLLGADEIEADLSKLPAAVRQGLTPHQRSVAKRAELGRERQRRQQRIRKVR